MEGPGQEAYEERMRRSLDPEGYEDPGIKSSSLSLGEMSRAGASTGSPLHAWRARAEELTPLRQYLPSRRRCYDLDGRRRAAGAPPGQASYRGGGQRE